MFKILVSVVLLCVQTDSKEEYPGKRYSAEDNSEGGHAVQGNSEGNNSKKDYTEENNSKNGRTKEDSSIKGSSRKVDTKEDSERDSKEKDLQLYLEGKNLQHYLDGKKGTYLEYIRGVSDEIEKDLNNTLKSLNERLPCSKDQFEKIEEVLHKFRERFKGYIEIHKRYLKEKKNNEFRRIDFNKMEKEKKSAEKLLIYYSCESQCATKTFKVKCMHAKLTDNCEENKCYTNFIKSTN